MIAQINAKKKGVKCDFFVANVLGNLDEVKCSFDFAYDWELLHHIFPEQRQRFMLRMFIKYSILEESFFPFVLVKRIPISVVQENTEKHDWVLFCIFLQNMN